MSTQTLAARSVPTARAALVLTLTVAVAIALNAVVAAVAIAAGAPATYAPLTLPVFGVFTAAGITVGWFGWRLIARRARHPRRILALLVPVVLVLSFAPDIALLVLEFIPGTTTAAAVALMVMHVVVAAVAVPVYALLERPRDRAVGDRGARAA